MKLNAKGVVKKYLVAGTCIIAAGREALGGNVARRISYRHIDVNEEGGIKKNEDAPEEVMSAKKLHIKRIFEDILQH